MCNGLVMNPTWCIECEILFCKKCIMDNICCDCGKFCKETTSRLIKYPLENISITCPNKCDKKIVYKDITQHLSELCEK